MSTTSLIHQLGLKWPGWLSWLERAYQRQALRQAITRIYPSFARQYPEWVNYLFDEPFLRQSAFPLLARYLEYKVVPAPFELAQVWAEQFAWFNLEMKERHVAQLMPVARDFLRRLNKELFN
jgi:hypothetical protein